MIIYNRILYNGKYISYMKDFNRDIDYFVYVEPVKENNETTGLIYVVEYKYKKKSKYQYIEYLKLK